MLYLKSNLSTLDLEFDSFWASLWMQPSVSHLKPFGCKCFVLKCGNLDKFESRSSDGILLGYTPHDRFYRVFNLETNTVVESYHMTFDETAPCPRDIFVCASDKEMEESIFVDEELQGFDCDKDESLNLSTSSPELVPASTLEADAPQQLTHHGLRGRLSPSRVLPLTFRRRIHLNRL
jgi:hypothetical protein